jgi:alpha-L-arabinofuranosidase
MPMRLIFLAAVLGISSAAQTTFVRATGPGATVEIDAARRAGWTIPRTIYGTFLEPLGRSIYGGLWAQELENPSFEDNLWSAGAIRSMLRERPALAAASKLGLPLPWEPLRDQGARYEPRWGDAANSSRSLLIMGLPATETGIRQQVYLPVHRVPNYGGALYAKGLSGRRELTVSIRKRDDPDRVLASAALSVAGTAWQRYPFRLELKPGALDRLEPVDFAIAVNGETRVLIDQAALFPADAVDGMDPDMIEMARALKTPLVRFGGNYVSGYHWRGGIGPRDRRVTVLNQAWGMPEYNQFGTDEFLRFCELIGAAPQIALNLGSGTPQEAAEWVRYVNARWAGGRRSRSQSQPRAANAVSADPQGGLLWELGNELYGKWQIGYPTQDGVAERTRIFAEAVRAIDPRAQLIATGDVPDRFREWNAAQMASPTGLFDYLSTHWIVGSEVRKPEASPGFIADAGLALPIGLELALREMKAQIDADSRWRGRLKIAFTEWLFWSRGPHDGVGFSNMGGALAAAGFLNMLMRVADFTPIADMTGLVEFGGIWKKRGQVYGVPAYWAFRMYSNADVNVPVAVRVTGPGRDIEQGNRISKIRDVPYLDIVAALNQRGDRLTIFALNRNLERDIAARISVAGFQPSRSAHAATLTADTIYDTNDEVRPDAVRPRESNLEVPGGAFEYTFPKASVTVLELGH